MAHFKDTGNAITAVWQACLGARFRLVPQRGGMWYDVVDETGMVIGEANSSLYGSHGFTLHLRNGSYSGFIEREQCDILGEK